MVKWKIVNKNGNICIVGSHFQSKFKKSRFFCTTVLCTDLYVQNGTWHIWDIILREFTFLSQKLLTKHVFPTSSSPIPASYQNFNINKKKYFTQWTYMNVHEHRWSWFMRSRKEYLSFQENIVKETFNIKLTLIQNIGPIISRVDFIFPDFCSMFSPRFSHW